MAIILVLSLLFSAYFSCIGRIYAVLDQSSLINDLKEEKKRILFGFFKEIVTGDTFFFYVSMMLAYFLFFSLAASILFQLLNNIFLISIQSLPLILAIVLICSFAIMYVAVELLSQILVKIRGIHNFQITYFFALLFYLLSYPILHILFSFYS